jgi:hypothetical protein
VFTGKPVFSESAFEDTLAEKWFLTDTGLARSGLSPRFAPRMIDFSQK